MPDSQKMRSLIAERDSLFERFNAEKDDGQRTKWAARLNELRSQIDNGLLDTIEGEKAMAMYEAANRGDVGTSQQRNSYRNLFKTTPRTSPFESFRDFIGAISTGDSRLGESRAMAESAGSSGGFAVPDQFFAEILDSALEDEIIRPRATVYPMTSDTMKVPAWAGATHSSTLYGGFSGAWLSEGETATRETPTLRQIELNAHKLGIFVAASSELAADGIGFEQQLARAMVKAISWYAEEAFIAGTGAGQPLGLLNDPAKIAITPSGGVGSIGASDLINALARLHPACYQNALWIASSEVMGKIWLMADGMGNPIYRPEEVNGQGRLMGLPVRVSEHCSQVGTEGDLILCDPTQYVIGLRKDAILEKTNAASWTSDQVDYRVLLRVDGQGSWESAITPANGGDSLSYVVTIGTRS